MRDWAQLVPVAESCSLHSWGWHGESSLIFLLLSCWLFLLKNCKRYQVSPRRVQKEILKSSKNLWYWKILSCIVHNSAIIKVVGDGVHLYNPKIFISKWGSVAIIFVGWIVCLNSIFLHAPEHWESSSRRSDGETLTLSPGTALDLCSTELAVDGSLGVLGGGKKCCANANKCLRDARDTALVPSLRKNLLWGGEDLWNWQIPLSGSLKKQRRNVLICRRGIHKGRKSFFS